ncbi:MAG: DUF7467 domain-containing protein, partial [Planctomycetota bacterium]
DDDDEESEVTGGGDDDDDDDSSCDGGSDGDASRLQLFFSALGDCLEVSAAIDIGCELVPVEDGQIVELTCVDDGSGDGGESDDDGSSDDDDEGGTAGGDDDDSDSGSGTDGPPPCSAVNDGDVLHITAPQAVLVVTAIDASGEIVECTVDLCMPPQTMTVQFTGDDCTASAHLQERIARCVDYDALPETVHVIGSDSSRSDDKNAHVWFSGDVSLGDIFLLDAAGAGVASLGETTWLHVLDLDGALLQSIAIGTARGEPLFAGNQFGSALVMAAGAFRSTPVSTATATAPMVGDTNGDRAVDVSDMIAVILAWGACDPDAPDCTGDLDRDGVVSTDDLLIVLLNWRP